MYIATPAPPSRWFIKSLRATISTSENGLVPRYAGEHGSPLEPTPMKNGKCVLRVNWNLGLIMAITDWYYHNQMTTNNNLEKLKVICHGKIRCWKLDLHVNHFWSEVIVIQRLSFRNNSILCGGLHGKLGYYLHAISGEAVFNDKIPVIFVCVLWPIYNC